MDVCLGATTGLFSIGGTVPRFLFLVSCLKCWSWNHDDDDDDKEEEDDDDDVTYRQVLLQCFCSVSVVFLNTKKHVTNEVELTYLGTLPGAWYLAGTTV